MKTEKPNGFAYNPKEVEKLAKICSAARAFAEALHMNKVTEEQLLPLFLGLAKKELKKLQDNS